MNWLRNNYWVAVREARKMIEWLPEGDRLIFRRALRMEQGFAALPFGLVLILCAGCFMFGGLVSNLKIAALEDMYAAQLQSAQDQLEEERYNRLETAYMCYETTLLCSEAIRVAGTVLPE